MRPLHAGDRDKVLDLLRATGSFSDAELDVADELVTIVLSQPHQTDYYAFVCEERRGDEGVLTGFVLVGPTPATSGTWDLYWIASHPSTHGTGVAQTLDSFAKAFVRERGGYLLLAETSGRPGYARTRAFYRKQGYAELARIPDYYALNDDLVVFGARLGPVADQR